MSRSWNGSLVPRPRVRNPPDARKYAFDLQIYRAALGNQPQTYALRGARPRAAHTLAAPIPRIIALTALAALGLSKDPFHEPFHARALRHAFLFTVRNLTEGLYYAPMS